MTKLVTRVVVLIVLALLPTGVHSTTAKKVAKASRPPETLDPAITRLPPGFIATDFATLFKVKSTTPKSEFETTDHYRERIKVVAGDGFYGIALDLTSKYDADRQRFEAVITGEKLQSETDLLLHQIGSSTPAIVVKSTRRESGTYMGSNAFGVRAKVTRVQMTEDVLLLDHPSKELGWSFYIPVPVDRARTTKLAFLLVFKPEPIRDAGLTTTASGYSESSVDFPYDVKTTYRYIFAGDTSVWAYDKRTGEVLTRYKLTKTPLPAYPGSVAVTGEHWNVANGATEQFLDAADPLDKVLAFYQDQLEKAGFIVSVNRSTSSLVNLAADSADNKRHVRIMLTSGDGDSHTTISYQDSLEEDH